jgi:hypothetical protein
MNSYALLTTTAVPFDVFSTGELDLADRRRGDGDVKSVTTRPWQPSGFMSGLPISRLVRNRHPVRNLSNIVDTALKLSRDKVESLR